jgi:hypothetical protein
MNFGSDRRKYPAPPSGRATVLFRDRTPPTPAPAPQPDAPTWADERAAVFDAICALRQLCEALSDQLAELRSSQTREVGMLGAWRALNQWGDAECARIEQESLQQQRGKEEPLDLPPLHSLRQ